MLRVREKHKKESVEPNVEKSNIHIAFSGYVGTCRDGPVSCGFDAAFEHGDRGGQFEALCGGDTGADAKRQAPRGTQQPLGGRCHTLFFGSSDKGLRRRGWREDRGYPFDGHQSPRRVLRRHTAGQCAERTDRFR